ITFNDIVETQTDLTSTSATPNNLANNTNYFWRVFALNAGGSSESTIWSFTTVPAIADAPTLVSPLDAVTDVALNSSLTWNAVSEVDSYTLEVATDIAFANIIDTQTDLKSANATPNNLTNNTNYFWRVFALNAGGSSESVIWSFTTVPAIADAPTLVSPLDAAMDVALDASLTWNAVSEVDSYTLEIATDIAFANIIDTQTDLTSTNATPNNLANNTNYFWRVFALNAGGSSESTIWSFTTVPAIADAPTLVSPLNTATDVALDASLTWNAVSEVDSYTLEIATDITFNDIVETQTDLTNTSTIPNNLANNTDYFWRVFALNAGGSSESAIWSFTTIPAIADAPTLVSPLDIATDVALNSSLTWNAVSEVDSYTLEVATDNAFANIVETQTDLTSTTTIPNNLANNTNYFWRVFALNAGGSSESAIWSFTTIGMAAGNLVAHWKMDEGSGTILTDSSPNGNTASTFGSPSWIEGKDSYGLRFNGSNQYASIADNNMLDISGAITIATWIKPERITTQYLVKKADQNGIDGYELSLSSTGKVFFRFNQKTSGNTYRLDSQVSYPSNGSTWMHVAVTYNGSEIKMYINGVENSSINYTNTPPISNNSLALAIGAGSDGFRGIMGAMDDVRIYNTALDANAIMELATINSSPEQPEIPLLSSPINGATNISINGILSWNSSLNSNNYSVQVSPQNDFSTLVFDRIGVNGTSITLNGLNNFTTYYWRVRGYNSGGFGAWSSTWSFTTIQNNSSNLVAHWDMNEGIGSSLDDSSTYLNNAVVIGSPSWVAGIDSYALRFNGSNQYSYAADNSSLDISGPITIASWIKPEKKATQYLVKKSEHNSIDGYELSLSSSGKIFFRFNQKTSGDTYRINSQISYPTNGSTWMHVAVTFNGLEMKIYINGIENSSKGFSWTPAIAVNSQTLAVGAGNDGYRGIMGAMDDVKIYNKALTASEVYNLFSPTSSLKNHFEISENSNLINSEDDEFREEFLVIQNPETTVATIQFSMKESSKYNLVLYDTKGTRISKIKEGNVKAMETNLFRWDGSWLQRGVYLLRLETASGYGKTLRIILR
ncbi:putative secreted protein (Por secretion system target), partial [Gillisia mitskevichiae]